MEKERNARYKIRETGSELSDSICDVTEGNVVCV